MVMQMLGSFAEFERSMVRERTRVGLAAARERGTRLGRPAKLSPHQQQEVIRTVSEGSKTAADAARLFGMHRSNITRLLARERNGFAPRSKGEVHLTVLRSMHKETIRRYQPRLNILACYALLHSVRSANPQKTSLIRRG
jgi:DNA invertase Pin-like site-specific DNA recombinase